MLMLQETENNIRPLRRRMVAFIVMTMVCYLCGVQNGVAQETHYDRIQLSARAEGDVKNDILMAILSVQRKGGDIARLADEVNRTVSRAIASIKQVNGIELQTLGYNTSAVYEKQHQVGWLVSQSIQLSSRDSSRLGRLIGELQKTMLLKGMGYRVSAKTRSEMENALIGQAITAFKQRAAIVTRQLGREKYRIVHLDISTNTPRNSPVALRSFQAVESVRAAPAAIESGKQQISVNVSGSIELQLK